MKKILFVSLFLIPYCFFAQQFSKVSYQININSQDFLSSVDSEYTLIYNSEKSLFEPSSFNLLDKVEVDRSTIEVTQQKDSIIRIKEVGGSRYAWVFHDYHFTNLITSEVYFNQLVGNKLVTVKKNEPFLRWKLLSSSDNTTIAGIKVQKALTTYMGRDYIAFFAPSIITSAAPFKFRGLPGLLVSLKSRDGYVSIELKDIQTNSLNEINYDLPSETLTFDEYKIALRDQTKKKFEAIVSRVSSSSDNSTVITVKFDNYMEIPDIKPLIISY
jgi:GLPGLI family protein